MEKRNATEKLEKAYFDMLKDTHYSKITVTDIITKANVSRTTFYRHYVDIFDLHQKIAEKLGRAILESCIEKVLSAKTEEECFDEILRVFYSQEKYIVLISGENGSRYFFEALFFKAATDFFPPWINLSEDQLFRLRFMTTAAIGTYIRDLIENRPHNTDYIPICKKLLNFEELFGGNYAK